MSKTYYCSDCREAIEPKLGGKVARCGDCLATRFPLADIDAIRNTIIDYPLATTAQRAMLNHLLWGGQ